MLWCNNFAIFPSLNLIRDIDIIDHRFRHFSMSHSYFLALIFALVSIRLHDISSKSKESSVMCLDIARRSVLVLMTQILFSCYKRSSVLDVSLVTQVHYTHWYITSIVKIFSIAFDLYAFALTYLLL